MKKIYFFIFFLMNFNTPLNAACHRAYVCNDNNINCQYQDICDSTIDIPSVGINPLPSMPSTQLKPLSSIGLPPLGTSQCQQKLVNGQWQNVCQ